jgi:hypothetical protein
MQGLVEVVTYKAAQNEFDRYSVDFLHQTVRDYLLCSEDVQSFVLLESGNFGSNSAMQPSSLWKFSLLISLTLCDCGIFRIRYSTFHILRYRNVEIYLLSTIYFKNLSRLISLLLLIFLLILLLTSRKEL